MKYAIIGAGGTGGCLGFFLKKAGKDVTLIARGKHLEAIRKNGLTIQKLWDESRETLPVKACTAEEYKEIPDVILVCVKGYSMDETVPTIKKIAGKETVVIPILNIYGTGGRLQKKLPELTVTDGCIYVSANIMEPGVILQHGKILRVVFGARKPEEETEKMREVAKDMVTDDLVERNLKILSSLSPEATTSMQRDVIEGKRSEMDGLVYEVVRMGREYKVSMPQYEKAAACFREQGIL